MVHKVPDSSQAAGGFASAHSSLELRSHHPVPVVCPSPGPGALSRTLAFWLGILRSPVLPHETEVEGEFLEWGFDCGKYNYELLVDHFNEAFHMISDFNCGPE